MARTANRLRLRPQRTDARPQALLQARSQQQPDQPSRFSIECNCLRLVEVDPDAGHLMLMPPEWFQWIEDAGEFEDGAGWRECGNSSRCYKTTDVCERLFSNSGAGASSVSSHPRFLKYLGSDPWTRFPIFDKPNGAVSLYEFLTDHRTMLYSPPPSTPNPSPSSGQNLTAGVRVRPAYRPLMCQWVLQALSAISFLHANGIMMGEMNTESCLLAVPGTGIPSLGKQPPTQLVLVGFPEVYYRSESLGGMEVHGRSPLKEFKNPTRLTDIYLVGCFIFTLMTAEPVPYSWSRATVQVVEQELGDSLEREYLGEIAKGCLTRGYGEDVQALRGDLIRFFTDEGWTVQEGDDTLQDAGIENVDQSTGL